MRKFLYMAAAVGALTLFQAPSWAQMIGTYDNFDCFNDTGSEAEGFEIDIEDVNCPDDTEGSPTCDLTRVFPSNFASTPWVIRYGIPTITTYDFTSSTADPQHTYDQGHKGVLVTYAATWSGSQWIAPQASSPDGNAGNGTPYNKNPTLTAGDSCWWYGLLAKYPTSGCDHFGISFAPTAIPGKITYHWKVPDPNNVGQLINYGTVTSLPPSPSITLPPPGGGQVQVVAQGEDNGEGARFGTPYFVKVTTTYAGQDAVLENLQDVVLKKVKTKKIIGYHVVQMPPPGGAGEIEDQENDQIPGADVQVTQQFQYFLFAGSIDAETGEAVCDTAYPTQADALAGTNPIQKGDSCSILGNYWVINSYTDQAVYVKTNMGKYVGEHINAANIQ